MKVIWENTYRRLIQAVYTEDRDFVRRYGPTFGEGVQNSLKMALDKKTTTSRVYRVEDESGVIQGFAILDSQAGKILEAHVRPAMRGRALEFYNLLDELRNTGNNYQTYVLNECELDTCAFIQATTTCNALPIEFKMDNGVLKYRFTWSSTWNILLDINGLRPPAGPRIELRKLGHWIQWHEVGNDTWYNLYDIDQFAPPGEYQSVRLPVAVDGQTVFVLPGAVRDLATSFLFVNGQKRYYPQDFQVVGTNLTWLDTDFSLRTTFEIDFYYKPA